MPFTVVRVEVSVMFAYSSGLRRINWYAWLVQQGRMIVNKVLDRFKLSF